MSKVCTYENCTRGCYGEFCIMHKPRTPLKKGGTGRPMWSSIRKQGKESNKWRNTRQKWLKENPFPLHTCHYCHKSITTSEMTLDHKIPRSRAPELRYDFDNLVPCCWRCNGLKGSIAHDDYEHNCNSERSDHDNETEA